MCVTGAPGAGKTTVGAAIASRAPSGAHIQVDLFRKMVRSGYASPHHWSAEVERQYDLARRAAAATALTYARGGFTVVIDDIIPREVVPQWRALLEGQCSGFVLLNPPVDVALARNQARSVWTVDPQVVRDLHATLSRVADSADWLVVDTSVASPEEAADRVLAVLAA